MSNILPKKSWHVYSEKNREKVREDEEKANKEFEVKKIRHERAESEHRFESLRSKAGIEKRRPQESFRNKDQDKGDVVERFDGRNKNGVAERVNDRDKNDVTKRSNDQDSDPIRGVPVYSTKGNVPWYARVQQSRTIAQRDEIRKEKEDPLNAFKKRKRIFESNRPPNKS